MRVFAVDPGYDRMGVALLDAQRGRAPRLLFSETCRTDRRLPFPERLAHLTAAARVTMEKFSPEVFALERLYFSKNKKTALRVSEVRGALLALAQERGLRIEEYAPAEVKIALTGYGKSDKKGVSFMVGKFLSLSPGERLDDEYDAIAVGLACVASLRRF